MKKVLYLLTVSMWLLSGCSQVNVSQHKQTSPELNLFDYFEGKTRAWGIFQGRNGEMKRQFTVDIVGTIIDGQLKLVEDFVYNDGEKSQRIWHIEQHQDGSFKGNAADIIGDATGMASGSVLNWKYSMNLPYKDGTIAVDFDDWMFLQTDDVLINRAKVKKFGFTVGEVTLVFQKISG